MPTRSRAAVGRCKNARSRERSKRFDQWVAAGGRELEIETLVREIFGGDPGRI